MQTELSMLDKFYFRLRSQHACFAWLFEEMQQMPGPVFELGLGKGRTYDHLRRNQPDREIYVFERDVRPMEGCLPPDPYLVRGDIEVNLPLYVSRFAGKVALVHSDVGDISAEHNRMMSELVPRIAPPALMPGGYLLSDLNLELPGFERLPLPPEAVPDRYFIYRKSPAANS
jgi:hypothetical protein